MLESRWNERPEKNERPVRAGGESSCGHWVLRLEVARGLYDDVRGDAENIRRHVLIHRGRRTFCTYANCKRRDINIHIIHRDLYIHTVREWIGRRGKTNAL